MTLLMQTKLIIDNREHNDLIALLQSRHGPIIEMQNLPHGDFHVVHPNLTMILERKSVTDLLASVKDTRYSNQKAALKATYPREHLYYILEGIHTLAFQDTTHDQKIATGCILSTMIRDDLKVFFTKSITDTADLITAILTRLEADPNKFVSANASQPVILNATKKKAATAQDTFHAMLCQIPGISAKTAETIASTYPSMYHLSKAIQDQGIAAFKDIKSNNRKMSSTAAQNIVDLLMPPS